MDWAVREKSLGWTQEEILCEMASALGRIGNRLAELIQCMESLRQRIRLATIPERQELVVEYQARHKEARLYYWYLIVQRESLGLRNHQVLKDVYRIPRLTGVF